MPVMDTGEVTLFFTDSGASDGPPVVLVHGWTCDSHDWSFQVDALGERHRVLAADLRGHGRSSPAADGDYTVQRHAADVATLLTRLSTGPVVVIGHSLGASVAAALAVEHPELVRAMVAVEPAYGQDEQTVEWMRQASASFGDDAGSVLAADLQAATEAAAPRWLRTWHRRRTLGMDPDLLKRCFDGMYFAPGQFAGQPHTDPYLARRTCPTLAFHRVPTMAAWEAGTLRHPCSRVVSWEGSGHWLHQERVSEFNALVMDWLADLPAADPLPAELPHAAHEPSVEGAAP